MSNSIHPRLEMLDSVMEALVNAARETLLQTAKLAHRRSGKAGEGLKPGVDTPLWNELRRRVTSQLVKRGEKVRLARFLGVPRQRLHLILKAQSAMPDAERSLLMLAWVIAREQGKDLG
ncbi:MAG: hypothetical protein QM715_00360 [Nibricoccus sp.]